MANNIAAVITCTNSTLFYLLEKPTLPNCTMKLNESFLFHFTGKDALKGILQNGYRVTFSNEVEYTEVDGGIYESRKAIPMVCFCDLPLSQIKSHAEFYSTSCTEIFGLGMTRSWAERNGLNPIIYVSKGSYMYRMFTHLNEYIDKNTLRALALDVFVGNNRDKIKDLPHSKPLLEFVELDDYINDPNKIEGIYEIAPNMGPNKIFTRFQLFYKPTIGLYDRNGQIYKDHRYYFEREWRYIPERFPNMIRCSDTYTGMSTDSIEHEIKVRYDQFLQRKPYLQQPLSFSIEDISQIIVNNDQSIEDLKSYILSTEFERVCLSPLNSIEKKNDFINKIMSWDNICKKYYNS